jgi:nucleoside-diphosphate-sugar epimerase
MAAQSKAADGKILNAGLGRDISIRDLASLVADPAMGGHGVPVRRIVHDHPQAEIAKLLCDNRTAERLLGWKPEVDLPEGIRRTRAWIARNPEAL